MPLVVGIAVPVLLLVVGVLILISSSGGEDTSAGRDRFEDPPPTGARVATTDAEDETSSAPTDSESNDEPVRPIVVAATTTTSTTNPPTTLAESPAEPVAAPPPAAPAPATAAPATAAPPPPQALVGSPFEQYQLATSTTGVPIIAYRGGTPGGVPVVVIGGVYPEARRGEDVANALVGLVPPAGIDLYVVPNPNPIGSGRANVNGVNLNRNFTTSDWSYIAPGRDHSGSQAGSEAETQNLSSLFDQLSPALVVIASDTRDGAIDYNPRVDRQDLPNALAAQLGLPVKSVPCDSCTGNLTTYVNERHGDAFFLGVPSTFNAHVYATALLQLVTQI